MGTDFDICLYSDCAPWVATRNLAGPTIDRSTTRSRERRLVNGFLAGDNAISLTTTRPVDNNRVGYMHGKPGNGQVHIASSPSDGTLHDIEEMYDLRSATNIEMTRTVTPVSLVTKLKTASMVTNAGQYREELLTKSERVLERPPVSKILLVRNTAHFNHAMGASGAFDTGNEWRRILRQSRSAAGARNCSHRNGCGDCSEAVAARKHDPSQRETKGQRSWPGMV